MTLPVFLVNSLYVYEVKGLFFQLLLFFNYMNIDIQNYKANDSPCVLGKFPAGPQWGRALLDHLPASPS